MHIAHFTLIASSAPALMLLSASQAAVIADQPYGEIYAITSQHMPDELAHSAQAYDDFSLDTTTDLSALTIYGVENGNPGYNISVVMQITSSVGVAAPVLFTTTGTQVGADLVFDLTGMQLEAGHFWLSAFVVRPLNIPGQSDGGGQWFWGQSTTTNGEPAMWQNPGDGYGLGSTPILASQISKGGGSYDMAFILEGTAAPAPGVLALLGAAGLLGSRRRSSRPHAQSIASSSV